MNELRLGVDALLIASAAIIKWLGPKSVTLRFCSRVRYQLLPYSYSYSAYQEEIRSPTMTTGSPATCLRNWG